jgi:hypothetical protein
MKIRCDDCSGIVEHIIEEDSYGDEIYMSDFREWFWRTKLKTTIIDRRVYKHTLRCKACGREEQWFE